MIELGPRGRMVFAAAWLAAQAALILTASRRSENAFGFRMFSESSTLSIHLMREVDSMSGHGTALVDVRDGEWVAHDKDGVLRRIKWRSAVHDPALSTFDQTLFASYGAAAQVARVQAALDYVARSTPDDRETRALVAEVTVRKNGREPYVVKLTSAPRALD